MNDNIHDVRGIDALTRANVADLPHRAEDIAAMRVALEQARLALDAGEIAIGAVVLDPDGAVVAAAHNEREHRHDPTAHAEVLALRAAAADLGDWRLVGHTLVVTVEPCPMCAGAAVLARVGRVVFGACNAEYGAAGSTWDVLRDKRMSHRPEVTAGVLAGECGTLVRGGFDR